MQKTLMEEAREGTITPVVAAVAKAEGLPEETIRASLANGRTVIPANPRHTSLQPVGIGKELRVKVNANIGNSPLTGTIGCELAKMRCAVEYGADAVMDLSTGPNAKAILSAIVEACPVPVGTVPIYHALALVEDPMDITADLILEVIEQQALQGVDFMTVHAGLLRAHVPAATRRLLGIVSRGGSILAKWMSVHGRENPIFTNFDKLLDLCRRYEITLSLGDGMRPGCLADASDEAQFAELSVLGDLIKRCREAGVQAMVEGPGHIPLDQVQMNMEKEEELCDGAPFYILGPVVTDCAPGYDHLVGSIGGALGAFHGAAMLCYVTPKEHLGLPDLNDVREGVMAFKIAAHVADIAKGFPHARERDDAISAARRAFDWERQFELALDPARARQYREEAVVAGGMSAEEAGKKHYCTMCGEKFCSMRISQEIAESESA